ncbi:MAG: dihydrodipicolinate synthase family protein [Lentisphaeria bacterium]|nr:dihydrodipicolinate synthase family protein [Lentisphaeria bacterium]
MFQGVYAALFTPFDETGEIVECQLREHVEWLVKKGISGLYICGNSGQGVFLSVEERKRVHSIVNDQVSGRAEVIAHVAALNTRDAKTLIDHSNEIGLDAVSSLSPIYWSYSEREVVNYYRDIMKDSDLPCLMYVKPGAGASEIDVQTVLEIAEIPGMVGMKYTSPNFFRMQDICLRLGGDWVVLSGPDELFLPALTMGVRGSIGTTQNVFPELFIEIHRCFKEGDLPRAMAIQQVITRLVSLYRPHGGVAVAHAMLTLRGFPLSLCRPPFTRAMPEPDRTEMLAKTREIIARSPLPLELECPRH